MMITYSNTPNSTSIPVSNIEDIARAQEASSSRLFLKKLDTLENPSVSPPAKLCIMIYYEIL